MDIDTIACEACGVRLLFSTPASWNQQQGMSLFSVIILFTATFNYMNFLTGCLLFSGEGSIGL